jgi:hypothetical protein
VNDVPAIDRCDFERLVADHSRLVKLINDLEYHLYALGERQADDPVAGCQCAAGALISALRDFLFRYDQLLLPTLESLVKAAGPIAK